MRAALLALVLLLVAGGAPAVAGEPPVRLVTSGSPLVTDAPAPHDAIRLTVTLRDPATIGLRILRWDGTPVRTLAADLPHAAGSHLFSWDGRDDAGALVPEGPWRVELVAGVGDGPVRVERIVARAALVPYPPAPGRIVVALNPGHGGPDSGAVYGGRRESDANLDIGLQLRAMLEASGIEVVMTRTADRAVNLPRRDVSGNGIVDHGDELVIRNDIANGAQAALFVTLMNNAYGCHCVRGTETYTNRHRTWSPEGVDLARAIQAAHLRHLAPFADRRWSPTDRGVRSWDFASVRPWSRRVMPRPALMPSVLVESLFMDDPAELRVLSRPEVRTALAAAYFEGIARFLSERRLAVRMELLDPPATAEPGATADLSARVVNTGTVPSAGWVLEARIVPADPVYYARPGRGLLLGEVPLPNGIAPGDAVEAVLTGLPLPPAPGDWTVLLDVRMRGERTLADRGSVRAQATIRIGAALPAAAPGDGIARIIRPDLGLPGVVVWRDGLPRDPLAGQELRGGFAAWPADAPGLRGVRPVDIAPDSAAGMAGVYGDDHPH